MKIEDVIVTRVSGQGSLPEFPPGDRQAQQMDVYPENEPPAAGKRSRSGPHPVNALYVEIRTDEGISGIFGPVSETQAFVIGKSLRPFLLGKDALATERLLDQMLRLDRHGRSGIFMTGVSPVDCALWDLKGKAWGKPVFRLLGGPSRSEVPAYASMLGFSIEPDSAATIAKEYKNQGYAAQKWFFRYGPGDGARGMELNLSMAQAVRDSVGPHYPLMFDAFMGWTGAYAQQMLIELEAIRPTWMEEPLPPERVGAFKKLRRATRVPIATGEHVYTRWQVKELLVNDAVDYIQADPDWTGGITELVKICALCSSFETPVVAHGHSLLPALHVAASQSPATVPYVEFLIRHQPMKQYFHKPAYQPESGVIVLPDLPGLGIVLDENKIESRETLTF